MSSWKGKSRGGYLGHLFFVVVLKHSNLSLAYFFLRFVAAYFLLFSPNAFRSLYYFYHKRLGFGLVRTVKTIYRNFYRFGQILLDKVSLFRGFHNRLQHRSVGYEYISKLEEMGRGGILICSHFGGWELSGYLLEDMGLRPKLVMLEAEHARIRQVLENASQRGQLDIIPVKNDLSHVFELGKSLRQKEIIAIHGDRFLPGSKTIRLPFLGKEAEFPLGPFALAIKFDVPVSFVFTTREKGLNYRCFASQIIEGADLQRPASQQQKIHFLMSAYVNILEDFIRQYPDQWFNYFDFWQDTPHHDHH